ncbi:GNAT family N-acetyltransferase [Alkalisalibacterium limincola]|uniref:GNAT family N-acetyltransferase n=1 Tax=Alkalisalibacterium limincola TaxID=2699169 RepID=A0A5C8L018_9GAMM|nr:GNAT family N-acetyltransferase [Alkalisalibacterium limincola]TXK65585.1 GNAT family N-acetyltransferase [Alkalisalibacterium limincola]
MDESKVDRAPVIRKAARIVGDTLVFRDAKVSDAEFILSLRTDSEKSRFLSVTTKDLGAQRAWLQRYAASEGQAYFIIECENKPIGTVRLYDAQGKSFCWGSWILIDGRPRRAAMESALMVYAYALRHLGFHECHFSVKAGNEKVVSFHERFGANKIIAVEDDLHFVISNERIRFALQSYPEFLSKSVRVEGLHA